MTSVLLFIVWGLNKKTHDFKPHYQMNKHCQLSLVTECTTGLYQLYRDNMNDFADKNAYVSRKA